MAYNWQCIGGHSGEIPTGTPLEVKARQRGEAGHLDAICLTVDECPECQQDRIDRLRRDALRCGDFGCPGDEKDCRRGCLYAIEMRDAETARVQLEDLQPT